MSFFSDLFKGGAEGIISGVGTMAKDIRAAITGKEPLTSEQQAAILERADALEAAAEKFAQDIQLGQIDLNKIDAQSGSLFKGGWRPAAAWVCVLGIAYEWLVRPILPWCVEVGALIAGKTVVLPAMVGLDLQSLIGLLISLLGLAGYRMREKEKGVASK